MKRVSLLLSLVAGLCMTISTANAQYRSGDLLASGGLAVGVLGPGGYGSGSSIGFPPLTVSVEYSLDDRFAVGPYMGFFTRRYKYANYRLNQTVVGFGGRGTFHATSSLNEWFDVTLDESILDIYGSVLMGFNYYSDNFNYYDASFPVVHIDNRGLGFVVGAVVGARYYFTPQLGVYGEIGRGTVGVFTLGMSARF